MDSGNGKFYYALKYQDIIHFPAKGKWKEGLHSPKYVTCKEEIVDMTSKCNFYHLHKFKSWIIFNEFHFCYFYGFHIAAKKLVTYKNIYHVFGLLKRM